METESNNIEEQIQSLMQEYGRLGFLNLALEKQKVTRQIIKLAKSRNSWDKTIHYSLSLTVIVIGLTGYHKSSYLELLFLIPAGVWWFWYWQLLVRRKKNALHELSKLATGIHAKKLETDQLEISK